MKQTKLALSAVMIVAIGLIGTNFVTGLEMTDQEKFDALSNSNAIYGHITLVHSDPDGNIIGYLQTDNIVSLIGKDCMAEQTFGTLLTNCTASGVSDAFDTIALFDNESFPRTMNATGYGLVGGSPSVGEGLGLLDSDLDVNFLSIVAGTVSVKANATGSSGTEIDITRTFTAGAITQDVNGAALFNNAQTAVLAGQTFNEVTLNLSDTLAITWTITIGG